MQMHDALNPAPLTALVADVAAALARADQENSVKQPLDSADAAADQLNPKVATSLAGDQAVYDALKEMHDVAESPDNEMASWLPEQRARIADWKNIIASRCSINL